MFKHSYETTAGAIHLSTELQKELLAANIGGNLESPLFKETPFLKAVIKKAPETNSIPVFHQPFMANYETNDFTFVDLRPYGSLLRRDHTGAIIFPKEGALGILIRRALLETEWALAGSKAFVFNINVPMVIFSKWIAGLLAQKLTLPEDIGKKVEALVAYYFYLLHYKEEELTPNLREVISLKVSQALNLEFSRVQQWFAQLPYTANLEDLALLLANNTGSVALRKLNKSILWAITSTSWFGGADVKELLAISLEYPPAFIALIYAGMTESYYRKAFLSNLIDREKRGKLKIPSFIDQVNNLLRKQFTHD